MTSKISFFSLRQENLKYRVGTIAVAVILALAYLVWFVMGLQNKCSMADVSHVEMVKQVTEMAEPEMLTGCFVILAGILFAVSSFRHLHSRTEVDLYYSLPVQRRTYFSMFLTNDMGVFVVLLAVVMAVRCLIVAAAGYFTQDFLWNTLWTFVCHIAVFAVTYLTMVLAMIMTGNLIVGILGFGVFAVYFPVIVRSLYPFLATAFYQTYCENPAWGGQFVFLSPVSLARGILADPGTWSWSGHIVYFVAACVWIVLLTAVDYMLYKRRNMEMAGKAMAFAKVKPVIRLLLVIPAAVYAGLFLYSISLASFKPWIVVGTVIGGALIHGIIEWIYQFDVHGLWSLRKQMLFSVAAALAIVGFFWLDIGGYDTYIPEKEKMGSVVIDNDYSGTTEAAFWGAERKGISGETMEDVLDILEEAVDENADNIKRFKYDNGNAECAPYTIKYKLKNGKEKKRKYILSAEVEDKLMEKVFSTEEYRKDSYSLYTADWSRVTEVNVSGMFEYQKLNMKKEQQEEFFRIYLDDLAKLDYKTTKTEIPAGQLIISYNTALDNRADGYCSDDIYYIYPSFENTIRYLRSNLNMNFRTSFEDVNIISLDVNIYNEETDLYESFVIREKEFLDSVKGNLIYACDGILGKTDRYGTNEEIDIIVNAETENGNESTYVYTDSDTIEKIKQKI